MPVFCSPGVVTLNLPLWYMTNACSFCHTTMALELHSQGCQGRLEHQLPLHGSQAAEEEEAKAAAALATATAALTALTEASNDTEGAEEASPAPAVEAAFAAAPAAVPAATPAAVPAATPAAAASAASAAEGTPAPEESLEQQAVAVALKVLTPCNADFGT